MKQLNNCLLLLFLLLGLSNLTAQVTWSSNPDASSKWQDDFEAFSTSGSCNSGANSNATRSVSRSGAGARGKVWKIKKDRGQLRAELSRTKNFQINNNQGRYYAWEMKIKQPTNSQGQAVQPSDDVTVWQWKSDENVGSTQTLSQQNYPLNMEYVNGYLELCAWRPQWPNWDNDVTGRISISNRKVVLWKIPVDHNAWMKFVIRIYASSEYDGSTPTNRENNTSHKPKGFIEFWYNGSKQVLSNVETLRNDQKIPSFRFTDGGKKVYLRTYDGIEGVYPKWGIYNQESCKYNMEVLLDNMMVTQKFSDIDFSGNSSSSSNWSDLSDGWYKIVPRSNTSMALTVDTDGNDNLVQWPWQDTDNQRFYVRRLDQDGTYRIETYHGEVMDVAGGSAYNNANILTWANNNQLNQMFKFQDGSNGYIAVKSKLNLNMGLAIHGNQIYNNRASVILWDYFPNANHQFKFVPVSAPGGGSSSGSPGGNTGNSNILVGKSPLTWNSGTYSNNYWLDRANDGNSSTRWASAPNGADADYISFDLGRTYNISQMKVNWEYAYGKDFGFCYWDGYNWVYMGNGRFYNNSSLNNSANVNVDARYIGLYVSKANNDSFVSAWEVEAYGTAKNNVSSTATGKQGEIISMVPVQSVKVFPNPTGQVFNVSLQGFTEANVEIADLFGRVVYTVNTKAQNLRLNEEGSFTAGTYIVKVTDTESNAKPRINKLIIR